MPTNCTATDHPPLTSTQQALARDVIEHLNGKWAYWILYVLGQAGQPIRFARLSDQIEGISQKVLTRTLRQLEGDGFLMRTIFAEVPPRVEYELTALGKELLVQVAPLINWLVGQVDVFAAARAQFSRRAT